MDIEALFAIEPQPALGENRQRLPLYGSATAWPSGNTHAAIYDALRLCKDF